MCRGRNAADIRKETEVCQTSLLAWLLIKWNNKGLHRCRGVTLDFLLPADKTSKHSDEIETESLYEFSDGRKFLFILSSTLRGVMRGFISSSLASRMFRVILPFCSSLIRVARIRDFIALISSSIIRLSTSTSMLG